MPPFLSTLGCLSPLTIFYFFMDFMKIASAFFALSSARAAACSALVAAALHAWVAWVQSAWLCAVAADRDRHENADCEPCDELRHTQGFTPDLPRTLLKSDQRAIFCLRF